MLSRRRLLTIGGVAAGGAALLPVRELMSEDSHAAGHAQSGGTPPHLAHHRAANAQLAAAEAADPYTRRMPIPKVLQPVRSGATADIYELDIKPAQLEILPGLTTAALTYNGSFVGPTIRAKAGRRAEVRFRNRLEEPSNVHLHGANVPPEHDGYPMEVIEPGAERVYQYGNRQAGATLWYHDHAHHMEADHVYRGLHGFYLIEDEDEQRLRLPSGAYDVPIMLRDALFDDKGGLVLVGEKPNDRPTLLANGRQQPYFPVAARKYRLRLLNASIYRTFELNLDGAEILLIGSDGGLLPEPVSVTSLTLGPGERADVVVDFARHGVGGKLVLSDRTGPVMRFDVVRTALDASRVPDRLRDVPRAEHGRTDREFKLGVAPSKTAYAINDKTFDMNRVDTRVKQGTTEIWRIYNADTADSEFGAIPHTFHTHLVQFRVLDRDGKAPWPGESGYKDTVSVPAGESVRVQVSFDTDYTGLYLYHCHMQEHGVEGMMAQMMIEK
ncbi:multicopper oxidase family protein [Streptomyces sp. Da 82-17]|uniref:multicopper oxidase family protein n=1 Tax=Streptomyces sp. Da 82-17 TaxID=3377116 RepID=UPI0038D39247